MKIEQLNEAYSPSMPRWLRDWFNTNTQYRQQLLYHYHINLDTAEFINYPIPTSNRDPIKSKENVIVFYHFKDDGGSEYVHIGGTYVTATQSVRVNNKNGNYWDWRECQYLAWGWLFSHCMEICYIDTTDPKSVMSTEKQAQRSANSEYRRDRNLKKSVHSLALSKDRLSQAEQDALKSHYRYSDTKFDKSGYIINPNKIKDLLAKHPEVRAKKYQRKIPELYNRIKMANEAVGNAFNSITFDTSNEYRNSLSNLKAVMDNIDSAISKYNEVMQYLPQVAPDNQSYWTYEDIDRMIKNCENYLNKAESYIDKYIPAEIDWDSDDMYVDDED